MIKKNNFIELEYTGATEDGFVFDTTDKKTATENGLDNPQAKYGPQVICVGEQQVLKGLDEQIVGKEPGKEYTISVKAEDGFGKKKASHIQLIATSKFKKQGVNPMPGLQVNIDNMVGIVKTVTGGRTMVDFNHPLSSKDLTYKIKITKVVMDKKTQADSVLTMMFGDTFKSELKENNLKVEMKMKMPEDISKKIEKQITKLIPSINKVVFTSAEQ